MTWWLFLGSGWEGGAKKKKKIEGKISGCGVALFLSLVYVLIFLHKIPSGGEFSGRGIAWLGGS